MIPLHPAIQAFEKHLAQCDQCNPTLKDPIFGSVWSMEKWETIACDLGKELYQKCPKSTLN